MERTVERGLERARARGRRAVAALIVRTLVDGCWSLLVEWWDVTFEGGAAMLGRFWDDLRQDVLFAVRSLRTKPALVVVIATTLGFGIGGVAAMASVLRGTVFRTLPYAEVDELRVFSDPGSWAPRDLALLEDGTPALESVAAYTLTQAVVGRQEGRVSAESALTVSRDFFEVLGERLYRGGGFRPTDFRPATPAAVILSYELWVEMGSDDAMVGSFVDVDGSSLPVVGVTAPGFYYPDPGVRLYLPMQLDPASGDRFLDIVARVAPSVTEARLMTEGDRLRGLLGRSGEVGSTPLRLLPIRRAVFGQASRPLLLAAGALGLVLVMAVLNVGTLLLANARGRAGELAVRAAVGATHGRLVRQFMTEGAVLGLIGAAAALVMSLAGHDWLVASLPISPGVRAGVSMDARLVGFAPGLGVVVGSVTGFVASLVVPSGDVPRVRGAGRGSTAAGALLQNVMVVVQVALSVSVVAGAGVLVRSVRALSDTETGMAPGQAVVVDAVVGAGDYPPEARADLYRQVRAALASLPETHSVGLTQKLPLRGPGWNTGVRDPRSAEDATFTPIRFVTPGYFEALGIQLEAGRAPDPTLDVNDGEPVAWVSRALADRLFPDGDEWGQLQVWGALRQVVGVVGNVAEGRLTDPPGPAVYVSLEQVPRFLGFTIVARPRPGARAGYASRVQERLRERLPRLAIQSAMPFGQVEEQAQGDTLILMRLLVLLGALVLLVGAVGVNGAISQWVRGRVQGWAVALALGASPGSVIRGVLVRSAVLTLAGLVVGFALFAVAGAALDSVLFGVERYDPGALAVTSGVLFVTGILGAVAPALRARRTDPISLLRRP